jgi:glycosyltransferase involved in cell wall biosynthesis
MPKISGKGRAVQVPATRLYSASPPGGITGGPICALEHLRALKGSFAEVCFVLCESGHLEERARAAGVSVWCSPFIFHGLRRSGLRHFCRHIGAVLRSRWDYTRRLRELLEEKPGILHIHSRAAHLPYALIAAWRARVPVVVSIHEPRSAGTEGWLDVALIRLLADWVVFPAQNIQREYPGLLPGRQSVLRYFHPVVPTQERRAKPVLQIAMPGQMGHRKGTDVFLETCRLLREDGVAFAARFGGGGWGSLEAQTEAHRFIRDNHLESAVEDWGLLPGIAHLYAEMDVMLLTSRRDPLPRVVMEAMCNGVPVVASRVDGIPEMVEDGVTGILVEPGNAQGFATAVKRLLQNDDLRRRMGAAGRERAAELFSPESYAAQMNAVYGQLGNRQ